MIRKDTRSILLKFPHGLGDCAQLLPVLDQLRRTYPTLSIDLSVKPGIASLFSGHARAAYILGQEPHSYDQIALLEWHEAYRQYEGLPGTKATRCLMEVFGLWPDLKDTRVVVSGEARAAADAWVSSLPKLHADWMSPAFVAIHYQGATSRDRKDLPHEVVERYCDQLYRNGFVPVILDWNKRCPFVDQRRVFCPGPGDPLWLGNGYADAERLAALLMRAALVVGIDSGPGHLAQFCGVPTVLVWTKMHPYHFADPLGHVTHLVPRGHAHYLRGEQREIGEQFFASHYTHVVYEDVNQALARVTAEQLNLDNGALRMALTSTAYDARYYLEHKHSGLDYRGHGDWQVEYGRWLKESLSLADGLIVLDVGGAAGSIAAGLGKAGLAVHMVDLNNDTVAYARQDFGEWIKTANVCDAVNLHLFGDGTFDLVHAAQTFEHFRPELVTHILAELWRVLKPGGLLFTTHDTVELFLRQGRDMAHEDPTHVCVWPRIMWDHFFREAGFVDESAACKSALETHPLSFLKRYDWDWWVLRKPKSPEQNHAAA